PTGAVRVEGPTGHRGAVHEIAIYLGSHLHRGPARGRVNHRRRGIRPLRDEPAAGTEGSQPEPPDVQEAVPSDRARARGRDTGRRAAFSILARIARIAGAAIGAERARAGSRVERDRAGGRVRRGTVLVMVPTDGRGRRRGGGRGERRCRRCRGGGRRAGRWRSGRRAARGGRGGGQRGRRGGGGERELLGEAAFRAVGRVRRDRKGIVDGGVEAGDDECE